MARLTETQLKRTVSREREKQDILAQKIVIQEKKKLYGENWREVEQKRLSKDLALVMGDVDTPTIYNIKDINEYFDPISFYKDNRGENIQIDLENYEETEKKYKASLEELDKQLQKVVDEELENGLLKEAEIKNKGVHSKSSDKDKIIKATKKLNGITSKFFNRYIPLYNKHVCSCCGKPERLGKYWITYSATCSDKIDVNGAYHLWICKDCCYKLFGYLYTDVCDKSLEDATKLFCSYTNYYWDYTVFDNAKVIFENGERLVPFIEEYVKLVIIEKPGLTFMNSPFLREKSQEEMQELMKLQVKVDKGELIGNDGRLGTRHDDKLKDVDGSDYPLDWTKEDIKNKRAILKMVGYDPFEWESNDNKKVLYKDLLNILEPGMENDLVKFQAAIQIVSSFFRVRQMNKKQFELEQKNASLAEIKAVADLKTKELTAITQFSKDNGFSERYATAKAKGENTFTGIMAKMNEDKFEKAILNRYDIETSETIQQAADASFKAIFNQLSLGESDVWKITQEQLEELRKLRRQNSDLAEQLRKAKYELEKIRLEQQAKEEREKAENSDDWQNW